MVSIIPAERGPWDVISKQIGQNLSQTMPGAVKQGYQRQLGLDALTNAEKEIADANGDPYKIAMAFARAGAVNPSLERSLGPLMQTAMSNATVNRAFPNGQNPQQNQNSSAQNPTNVNPNQNIQNTHPQQNTQPAPSNESSNFAMPGPFNVMTPEEIDQESKRYAQALRDPNAYQVRQAQLQNQNTIATDQRQALEKTAIDSGLSPSELPRFMLVGQKFDPRNPSEWAQNTRRAYDKVKANDKKLENAFIPGLGSGLLGRDRQKVLNRLIPTVQDQVKLGLEQETRNYLADQYLSPTEIESLIHPIKPSEQKSINSLPKSIFPKESTTFERGFAERKRPEKSYEEILEKNPEKIAEDQNLLSDFFLNTVKPDTSLLVLRDKIWEDKDYDWRQIGPAIRQAEQKGLKLEPHQSTEMSTLETQPPIQSLGDMFQSFDRVIQYFRGNK